MKIDMSNWPIAPGDAIEVTVRGRTYEARVDEIAFSGQPHEQPHVYISNPVRLEVTLLRESSDPSHTTK